MNVHDAAKWLGWLLLAGYGALVVCFLLRYFRSALAAPGPEPALASDRAPRRRMWGQVLAAFFASRALVLLVCAAACLVQSRSLSGFFGELTDKLYPWDAGHYLDIIRNGYVSEGDERLFIVFFPFYPMVCRCFTFMTGLPAQDVAFAVSNAALVGCGAAMWRLVEPDGGEIAARRAMLLMMFSPMTYFYSIAYSEATFLLVTLLAVLMARRRRFGVAVLLGAMASSARVLGMATAIPIFWEMLRASRDADGEAPLTGAALARRVALCALRTLPVGLGFAAYLCLNWRMFGNPTQFMVFQREHWFQSFGDIENTFRYSLENTVDYDDFLYKLGVWVPQAALSVAMPLLLAWRGRRERQGAAAYALVYHYVAFAPTWLLSGARYASANYALYPMLSGIPERRRGFVAMMAAQCLLLVYMTWVGLWLGKVY